MSTTERTSLRHIIERQAALAGKTPSEWLRQQRSSLAQSPYPTENCLTTDEIERFHAGYLSDDSQVNHLEQCHMCAAVVEMARPTDETFEKIRAKHLAWARTRALGRTAQSKREELLTPVWDALSASAPLMVAALAVAVIAEFTVKDVMLATLMSMAAARFSAVLVATALLSIVAVSLLVRLHSPRVFQQVMVPTLKIALATGLAVYALYLSFYTNDDYNRLLTAQDKLVQIAADDQLLALAAQERDLSLRAVQQSENPRGLRVAISANGAYGVRVDNQNEMSVDFRRDRALNLWWSASQKRRSIGTVYDGTLKVAPDGKGEIVNGTRAVPVSITLDPKDAGQHVLGLVPPGTSGASKIWFDTKNESEVYQSAD